MNYYNFFSNKSISYKYRLGVHIMKTNSNVFSSLYILIMRRNGNYLDLKTFYLKKCICSIIWTKKLN